VLGGYIFWSLIEQHGFSLVPALLVSLVVLGAAGAATYVLMLRRLVGAAEFVLVIASLGLSVVIAVVVVLIWGPNGHTLRENVPVTPLVSIGNLHFSALDFFSIGLALFIIVVLDLWMRYTRMGVRMRAVADTPLLASLLRINIHTMSAIAWAIAAVCAGAAGVLYAQRTSLDPVGLQALGLVAFPAILLGGIDSIRGAMVGGLLLAAVQNVAIIVFGGDWSDVIAYAVLLVVLLVRPRGLFGSREVVRL
jgi:branched-chain amino acid transport system permease protein